MRFWDSSALVPLLVAEEQTPAVLRLLEDDAVAFVWWGTDVECASAIARREREGVLTAPSASIAFRRLGAISEGWAEIQPTSRVRTTAVRLLRAHSLRAADALQLAAAIVASEDRPASLPFVTLDDRLVIAADREGFPTVWPGNRAEI